MQLFIVALFFSRKYQKYLYFSYIVIYLNKLYDKCENTDLKVDDACIYELIRTDFQECWSIRKNKNEMKQTKSKNAQDCF
jgi:hypothetical protein